MKKNILNCIKKVSAGLIMSAMIIGSTGVSVKAADYHNFYTYYNDANIKQLQDTCSMPYVYGYYDATVTSINGNPVDKITAINGTQFTSVSTVDLSKTAMTKRFHVTGGTSQNKAQFLVTMYNYSANSLLNGTIYED
ncbi:MAG: hypothetical protein IJA34_04545 [Lachnospiraceae bacterium]|nr:hypothetical protein [Lachnospiraceae bacterium]